MTDFIAEMRGAGTGNQAPDPWEPTPFQRMCFRWIPVVAIIVAILLSHLLGGSG